MCAQENAGARRGQKRVSGFPGLELEAVVSHPMWMLGIKVQVLCKSSVFL